MRQHHDTKGSNFVPVGVSNCEVRGAFKSHCYLSVLVLEM